MNKSLTYVLITMFLFIGISCNSQNNEVKEFANYTSKTKKRIKEGKKGQSICEGPILSVTDIRVLSAKGNSGDADAAYKLWDYYAWNTDDYDMAIYWLQKAAENGNASAQFELGKFLFEGIRGEHPLPKDEKKGLYWINKAAESGTLPYAQYAKVYLGKRLSVSDISALTKLAEKGDILAPANLAKYYRDIEKNPEREDYWTKYGHKLLTTQKYDTQQSFNNESGK